MRQIPDNLLDFQRMFPNEEACLAYLEEVRWPDGFVCPHCKTHRPPYRFKNRRRVLTCRACRRMTYLTANTIMHRTKQPLHVWFWAAYLVTTQTPGMSALQFQRQVGIRNYEVAYQLLQKLRAGMIRPDRDKIGGEYAVEVDETWVGGRTKGEGRGVHHKALVIAAVEVRETFQSRKKTRKPKSSHAKGKPLRGQVFAGRLRLRVLPYRTTAMAGKFIRENIAKGSTIRTDGWAGYSRLRSAGYHHQAVIMDGDGARADEHLPMVHVVISNLKTWLRGTHHGVSQKHLQAYLNEYVFRFNRRFYPMTSFASVLGIGTVNKAPTYDGIYHGDWVHPNPS